MKFITEQEKCLKEKLVLLYIAKSLILVKSQLTFPMNRFEQSNILSRYKTYIEITDISQNFTT